jgi:hypothetical protein
MKQSSSLAYTSALKIQAICSSETSVDFHRTSRRYIPEDGTLHNHRCENLISYRAFINLSYNWRHRQPKQSGTVEPPWTALSRLQPSLSPDFPLPAIGSLEGIISHIYSWKTAFPRASMVYTVLLAPAGSLRAPAFCLSLHHLCKIYPTLEGLSFRRPRLKHSHGSDKGADVYKNHTV